ncbi:MAG: peptidoglycan-associated lipoprotein Pal [Candidatus Rokubacteria bacterium]|nr:peptidoglycan-associated lipoprotein Pal [Candidatus Rokubacteria bacterium]
MGTTLLRGTTPQGRVDIPWQAIERVSFERVQTRKTAADPAPPSPVSQAPVSPAPAVKEAISRLEDVFFDFDRYELRDDARATLDGNVKWLKARLETRVVVEGHCDERGTSEYNLALGERRAQAVRDYLVAAGVAASRLSTISYGEERPFVPGPGESAWKWNRRAHLVVTR